jgi:predicted ArsR family transcriptional regulator
MTTLAQLPETRRAVLRCLKERSGMTLAEVAQALKVTREAARQQLLQLELAGWVESAQDPSTRGRVGRPASVFQLSSEGEALFPKQYQALALSMLEALTGLGPEATKALLARIADARVADWEPRLAGKTPAQKARALTALYSEDDAFVELCEDGDDLLLIERNCPYLEVALKRPALCSVSVNVLARLLNAQVVREERFQEGHRRCVFRIKLGSTRGPKGFRLEETPR